MKISAMRSLPQAKHGSPERRQEESCRLSWRVEKTLVIRVESILQPRQSDCRLTHRQASIVRRQLPVNSDVEAALREAGFCQPEQEFVLEHAAGERDEIQMLDAADALAYGSDGRSQGAVKAKGDPADRLAALDIRHDGCEHRTGIEHVLS